MRYFSKICYNFLMFSDTHFHFRHIVRNRGLDGTKILSALAERNTFFALDIGTEADDLIERHSFILDALEKLSDDEKSKAKRFLHYSAGIWPSEEEIAEREERVNILTGKIARFEKSGEKIVAIGECGLDHHWIQNEFDEKTLKGESELFEMQLSFAREKNLPVVIHSREAFDGTVDSIRNVGWNCGVIHCFSYGIKEARIFLDLGWHIAFGGATTYAKKSKMDEMKELLRFVPDDMILLETDAPYLAPVPFRGQTNTPILVETVFRFIADARSISAENLSEIVDKNIQKLFFERT